MSSSLTNLLMVAGIALASASAASGATVSFNLSAPVLGGPFSGVPLDFVISYDDSLLLSGNEVLYPSFGDLKVEFDGDPDFEMVDIDYPFFPKLSFVDFVPTTFDFLVYHTSYPLLGLLGIEQVTVGYAPGVGFFDLVYDPAADVYSSYSTVVLMAPIPLPAGLPLLLGGLGLLGLVARTRTSLWRGQPDKTDRCADAVRSLAQRVDRPA